MPWTDKHRDEVVTHMYSSSSPLPLLFLYGAQEPRDPRKTSFSLTGASDCLHSSEHCAQFDLNKAHGGQGATKDYFTTLPLDADTADICSVYTSDKLNFL